ncbi:Hypothetical predicted protein [Cloeon dipterum]|uniref:Secreted protein n=1 Tax=Cloeon dipterum TaxID=197152 RepID=A0A8S1CHS7_9INSE|nr:Hypothetical predicted protein [Cloeon dipterum]
MISKMTVVACVFVVLASMSVAQKPFYAGQGPWYGHMGPQTDAPAATSTSNNINDNNVGGLGNRNQFLTPVESVSFRYYNNVPIEGPGRPCIGCVYRLTREGFVMVRP